MAEERNLHLLVGYGWNYLPWMREAKRLMDEHGVGEVEESVIQMSSVVRGLLANLTSYPRASADTVPEQATWSDPRNGGGYGQAQLTHALGAALWLTGLRGDAVFALMKAVLGAQVEHHDACVIRYDNGSIGTIAGASGHEGLHDDRHQLQIHVMGSDGELVVDIGGDHLWLGRSDGFEAKPEVEAGGFYYNCDGPPNTLIDLALGKDVENCSPANLGARTVEILDAAYRSAASGRLEEVRRDV
jgi:predicted dehydrogenase